MAQRSSRKNKGRKKQPELRTGGGRTAKAARARSRAAAGTTATGEGPSVRVRPAGAGGMAFTLLVATLGVALVAIVGLVLERWNLVSYPDTLWLYVAFGCATVAAAVGRVARSVVDADVWGLVSLLVPLGLLVVEAITGPGCPTGGECAAVGARGSLGIAGSLAVVALVALLSWGLARWMYRSAAARRPSHGRVRYRTVALALLVVMVFPGSVVGAALVGTELLTRDMPEHVQLVRDEVERECWGLDEAPELAVRAAPHGYNADWTTFAVRRAGEDRPGVGKQDLPKDWAGLDEVHPYEATVSVNDGGEVVTINCRRVGPGTGNAVADDLKQPEPDSNPMSPKTTGSQFLPRFFTQGVAGPTPEAAKAQRAEAAKRRTATAKAATDGSK